MSSREKPIVLVDMDGVMAGFDAALETTIRKSNLTIDLGDPSDDFYMTKRIDNPETIAHLNLIKNSQGFFAELPVVEGALDGWRYTNELGYHARILSTPLSTNPWSIAEKLAWLDYHLGPRVADEATLTDDKTRYSGIALIDDKPYITGAYRPRWQHALFTQPYNRAIETEFHIDGWYRREQIRTVLAKCAGRLS